MYNSDHCLFVRDSKSQLLAHAAHSSTSEERSSPDTSASDITAIPRRRPTYRRPVSEPPSNSRRRPTYRRPSPELPAEAGRRPTYRRPTPNIPARPSPRRTSQRPTETTSRLATLQKLRSARSYLHRPTEGSLTLGSRTQVRGCLPSIPAPPLFFWCFEDLGHRAEDTGHESRPKSSVDAKQIPQVGYRRFSFFELLFPVQPPRNPFSKPGRQLA